MILVGVVTAGDDDEVGSERTLQALEDLLDLGPAQGKNPVPERLQHEGGLLDVLEERCSGADRLRSRTPRGPQDDPSDVQRQVADGRRRLLPPQPISMSSACTPTTKTSSAGLAVGADGEIAWWRAPALGVPARQPCRGEHDGPAGTPPTKETLLRGDPLGSVWIRRKTSARSGSPVGAA